MEVTFVSDLCSPSKIRSDHFNYPKERYFIKSSLTMVLEDVDPKLCTSLLKGRARPPQVLEWFFFIN
jgi:hypothetical protein